VAIGLVHFSPHGRIVEICGDNIRRIYFRALGHPSGARKPKSGDEPFETEAFFGLVRTGKDVVAVGIDGVYRFGISKDPTRVPLPAFESIGNIGVSFAFPRPRLGAHGNQSETVDQWKRTPACSAMICGSANPPLQSDECVSHCASARAPR